MTLTANTPPNGLSAKLSGRDIALLTACMLGQALGVHALTPFTVGLFIQPLEQSFGWRGAQVAAGITILTLGTALLAPIIGRLADKIGERGLVVVGLLGMAAGYGLLSTMTGSLPAYWLMMAAMAVLGAGCSPVTLSRLLMARFDRRRGAALGVTLIGTGLPSVLGPLALGPILAVAGWRAAYGAVAITLLVAVAVVGPLLLVSRHKAPATSMAGPEAPEGSAAGSPPYRALLAAFFLVSLALGGVVVHFVPMLRQAGFSPQDAARCASLMGLALVAGRLLSGVAMDRIFAPKLGAGLIAFSAVGFLLLSLLGPQAAPWAALLVGASLGIEIDLVAVLASRYFPLRDYGRRFGGLYTAFLCGVAVSPLLFALVEERFGSFRPALGGAAILLALGAVILARLPAFPQRDARFGQK